jgi:hypothetical protein
VHMIEVGGARISDSIGNLLPGIWIRHDEQVDVRKIWDPVALMQ